MSLKPTSNIYALNNDIIQKYFDKLTPEYIKTFKDEYTKQFIPIISTRYLSHAVASIRCWYVENIIKNNPIFDINLILSPEVKIDDDDEDCVNKFRIIFYSHGKEMENVIAEYQNLTHISIFYPEESKYLDIKQIRIGIAHELGHTILVGLAIQGVINKNIIKEIKQEQKTNLEKNKESIRVSPTEEDLASLIGIILLAEKCAFHVDYYDDYMYSSLRDIVEPMKETLKIII